MQPKFLNFCCRFLSSFLRRHALPFSQPPTTTRPRASPFFSFPPSSSPSSSSCAGQASRRKTGRHVKKVYMSCPREEKKRREEEEKKTVSLRSFRPLHKEGGRGRERGRKGKEKEKEIHGTQGLFKRQAQVPLFVPSLKRKKNHQRDPLPYSFFPPKETNDAMYAAPLTPSRSVIEVWMSEGKTRSGTAKPMQCNPMQSKSKVLQCKPRVQDNSSTFQDSRAKWPMDKRTKLIEREIFKFRFCFLLFRCRWWWCWWWCG